MSSEDGFSYFGVNVGVTPEGLQHSDEIVDVVFQYVRMLKEQGPQVHHTGFRRSLCFPATFL